MSGFDIHPNDGPHAAASLTDEELVYLHRLIAWELALRTDRESFDALLAAQLDARKDLDDAIAEVRRERDRMHFIQSVLADIAQLPDVQQPPANTGMYL